MKDYSNLIGKTYRNGDDGTILYLITAIDGEFPNIVHAENTLTGKHVCALADLVMPNLID